LFEFDQDDPLFRGWAAFHMPLKKIRLPA